MLAARASRKLVQVGLTSALTMKATTTMRDDITQVDDASAGFRGRRAVEHTHSRTGGLNADFFSLAISNCGVYISCVNAKP